MYKYILCFLGLYEYKDTNNNVINYKISRNNSIKILSNILTDNDLQIKYKYIYNIFIFLIISINIILTLSYIFINNATMLSIFEKSFNFIFIVNYYNSISYFKKEHLYNIINGNNIIKKYNNYLIIALICIFILIILHIIFIPISYNYFINRNINYLIYFLMLCLILETLYGYMIFFLTIITFFIVMKYHKDNIQRYTEKVSDYVKKPTGTNTKINIIAIEYSRLKDEYSDTVDNLNNFFGYMHICSLISLYVSILTIQNNTYNYITIINTCIFMICEIMYVNLIKDVNINIDKIVNLLSSSQFVTSMFRSYNINRNIELANKDYDLQTVGYMIKNTLISTLSIDESIDWIILNAIMNKPWSSFCIFGIKLDDTEITHKFVGLVITLLMADSISSIFS